MTNAHSWGLFVKSTDAFLCVQQQSASMCLLLHKPVCLLLHITKNALDSFLHLTAAGQQGSQQVCMGLPSLCSFPTCRLKTLP